MVLVVSFCSSPSNASHCQLLTHRKQDILEHAYKRILMPSHIISYSRRTKHSQNCNQHSRPILQTGFHNLPFVLIWDENFVFYAYIYVNKLSFKDSIVCDHICKKGFCRWLKLTMLTFATKKGCCHWPSSTELFGLVAISLEACRYVINIMQKVLMMKHWWSLLVVHKTD